MNEKELQEIGARINVALALAGKKESLSDKIKEQNTIISNNNGSVAELQATVDSLNAVSEGVISSLSKELNEVVKELDTSLASLEKEGYKLPIGKKTGKAISL